MTNDAAKELFERYKSIEGEIRTLQEDKKNLLEEFKDRVDPKAFKAALAAAKSKARLKPHEANNFDMLMELLADELCVEHID
jgi:hypothetical protein